MVTARDSTNERRCIRVQLLCHQMTLLSHLCHNQELDSFCNPILSKPKPKIEAASEGQAKANGEHNGPVNGQSAAETKPEAAKDNPQQTKPPGEMEVD